MMNFAPTKPRRRSGENIVPMINVVFLLLIFFLMSAQIAPRDPFEMELPDSESEIDRARADTLYISAAGELHFDGSSGEAVFEQLAARGESGPLFIQADATFPASDLAALLPRLAGVGVEETRLVTGRR